MSFAFFFPGQGSQSLGMMNGFAEQAIVKATFDEASAVLGQDLWAMINGEDAELIGQTVNTQPIMLAAGIATYRAYLEAGGKIPSVVAGHSLGEYTALVAAGALNFADAVKLVRLRAELMQSAVPQGVGAMAAILGLEDEQVKAICAEAAQGEVVEAVNFNSPGQVVIAGNTAAVERAMAAAKEAGAKRALLLPVSVPSQLQPHEACSGKTCRSTEKTSPSNNRKSALFITPMLPLMMMPTKSKMPWYANCTARYAGQKPSTHLFPKASPNPPNAAPAKSSQASPNVSTKKPYVAH